MTRMLRSGIGSLVLLVLSGSCALATDPAPAGEWRIRWDRGFTSWEPEIFEGRLTLSTDGEAWSGRMAFAQSGTALTLESLVSDGDSFVADFSWGEGPAVELRAWIIDDRLIGEMRSASLDWQPLGGRRTDACRLVPGTASHSLPSGDVATSTLDRAALESLIEAAASEQSSALVVLQDGKILVERYCGEPERPLVAMSASKSVVSMAIGHLLAQILARGG